jgi:hypothetical protein
MMVTINECRLGAQLRHALDGLLGILHGMELLRKLLIGRGVEGRNLLQYR